MNDFNNFSFIITRYLLISTGMVWLGATDGRTLSMLMLMLKLMLMIS